MPYLTIAKWVGGLLGGLVVAWVIYAGVIRPVTKPNPTTQQKADTIINYNNQPRISFGCASWRINDKDNSVDSSKSVVSPTL